MRAMAVDFGFKKIGIAIGETDHGIATTRPPLVASGTLAKDAQAIIDLATREEARLIIMGLPVEESGIEGRMARICRTLGSQIVELGLPVEYVDESYTSLEATARLAAESAPVGRSPATAPRRQEIHGEAAILILERYLG